MSRTRPILRAELLQWVGLGAGALTWAGQLLVGFGTTVANCSAAGAGWAIGLHTWEVVLTAIGAVFVLGAESAAVSVFLATRELEYDGPPPDGRRHFFASAAMVGNLLFLVAILLSGVAAISHEACRQA